MLHKDLVVVALRVSKEQRRLWRVEAGKEDKSVQGWILGRLGVGAEAGGKREGKKGGKGKFSAYTS